MPQEFVAPRPVAAAAAIAAPHWLHRWCWASMEGLLAAQEAQKATANQAGRLGAKGRQACSLGIRWLAFLLALGPQSNAVQQGMRVYGGAVAQWRRLEREKARNAGCLPAMGGGGVGSRGCRCRRPPCQQLVGVWNTKHNLDIPIIALSSGGLGSKRTQSTYSGTRHFRRDAAPSTRSGSGSAAPDWWEKLQRGGMATSWGCALR